MGGEVEWWLGAMSSIRSMKHRFGGERSRVGNSVPTLCHPSLSFHLQGHLMVQHSC